MYTAGVFDTVPTEPPPPYTRLLPGLAAAVAVRAPPSRSPASTCPRGQKYSIGPWVSLPALAGADAALPATCVVVLAKLAGAVAPMATQATAIHRVTRMVVPSRRGSCPLLPGYFPFPYAGPSALAGRPVIEQDAGRGKDPGVPPRRPRGRARRRTRTAGVRR